MKIKLKNLGILKVAEFELNNFTIICGKNNTGKTYAVYAVYGFLKLWREFVEFKSIGTNIQELFDQGATKINLDSLAERVPEFIKIACDKYSKLLYKIFAAPEYLFKDVSFQIEIDIKEINLEKEFYRTIESGKKEIIVCNKEEGNHVLDITSLHENRDDQIPLSALRRLVNRIMIDIFLDPLFPDIFIASAERTGVAIFQRELDFARNRLLDEMGSMERNLDPFTLLDKVYGSYALPVKDDVDFTRNFKNVFKEDSFLMKNHPDILTDFADIIGGDYRVVRGELYFTPHKSKIKLTMNDSSSAIRSLLDIGFFLKHMVEPGDILIVDEPELNLHPENQRKIARLFARLVNIGINVFITTHSDYIIKELNTLIMLNSKFHESKQVMEKFGYNENELLSAQQISVYNSTLGLVRLPGKQKRTRAYTFYPCNIDPNYGIEVGDFDDSIIEMNEIQEDILLGIDE